MYLRYGMALTACALMAGVVGVAHAEQVDGLWARDNLTGDWGGARSRLEDSGVAVGLTYIGEGLTNRAGGHRPGSAYEGRADLSADLDFDKLLRWEGATAHATAYMIHGRGLSVHNVVNLMTVSSIEAPRANRLFTLWLQQNAYDDRVSLCAGQLAADEEFAVSPTAANLINSTFGWPAGISSALPGGGPVYPVAAPGARLRVDPTAELSVLAGVFSGIPERLTNDGTRFRYYGGSFVLAEVQYALGKGGPAAGIYKLGAWRHTGKFNDQETGGRGVHDGDHGFYAIADQIVWARNDVESLSLFLRLGAAPADRNMVDRYVDAGIGYKGLIASRADDVLTLGVAYARFGAGARAGDRNGGVIERDHEKLIELSYLAQLAPWWTVQPDLQYVIHPAGGLADPDTPNSTTRMSNAKVAGVRTTIKF